VAVVVILYSSQDSSTSYRPIGGRNGYSNRCLLFQRLMRASGVVIGNVFAQHSPQMGLVENEQFIEAFVSDRSHPPLRVSGVVGSARWGMDGLWICTEANIVSNGSVNFESLSWIRK